MANLRGMQAAWIPNQWDLQMIAVQNRLQEAKKIEPRVRARLTDLDRLTKKHTKCCKIPVDLWLGIWKAYDTWYLHEYEAKDSYLPQPVNVLIDKIIA